jgi:aspartate aminotransferase
MKGWARIEGQYKSEFRSSKLTSFLLEAAKVAVVPGIAFGSDNHIRLSFATSDKNITEGVKRIHDAISTLS